MTCRRVVTAVLVALLGYVTLAIGAFVYLPWWQAGLVLAAAQLVLVLLARWWLRRAAARLLAAFNPNVTSEAASHARAEVDVHAVRPLAGGPDRRIEVELSLFPVGSSAGPPVEWDATALAVLAGNGDKAMATLTPENLRVRAGDGWRQPVGPLTGPERLRFELTLPPWARRLTLCRRRSGGLEGLADLPLAPVALGPGADP